jgi:hypothetical protein
VGRLDVSILSWCPSVGLEVRILVPIAAILARLCFRSLRRMRGVVVIFVLLVVVSARPSAAWAHEHGRFVTEAEAAALLESAQKTPQGVALSDCDGVDRAKRVGSRLTWRHFYCFYSTVSESGGGELEEFVLRLELHVLPNGVRVSQRVRNWTSTPFWIDDPPTVRLPAVVGKTFGLASKRLARLGFDRGDLDDNGLELQIAHATYVTSLLQQLLVCKTKLVDSKGHRTLRLWVAYPACEGTQFQPPKLPPVRGLPLPEAVSLLGRSGIAVNAEGFGGAGSVPNGTKQWVVCGYRRDDYAAGQRSWDAYIEVSRNTCPRSWGPKPDR